MVRIATRNILQHSQFLSLSSFLLFFTLVYVVLLFSVLLLRPNEI